MLISQTAEYALRSVVWLAANGTQTTRQIASGTQVPADYLSKVLQALTRHGVVSSQRGKHGGFKLATSPESLRTLDVIDAVDPIRRIESCPLELESHCEELCPLHRHLDDAIAQIQAAFASTTIADLQRQKDLPSAFGMKED
ncbi:MAG: Rrf2 family transcriptional regulator [Deltaproteobacteria bacterium]|nr:Rrf2 family transcriptional regulator [Deltaproteobacteria bacterium]